VRSIIETRNIRLKASAKDWEEAMRLSGQLLVDSGYIEEAYIEMTINTVKEMGPYIVIGPGLALSHSRPDASVKRTGISLLTLDQGVDFGSELGPVWVVITLAAQDNNSHIDELQAIAGLCSDEINIKKICEAKDVEKIAKMFNAFQESGKAC